MLRFLVPVLTVILSLPGWADCRGQDMLAQMTPDERAELEQAAATYPYPEGLLWRGRQGDTEIVLFGTFHIQHDFTAAHLDVLMRLADHVDIAWLEMNAADTRAFTRASASDPSVLFNPAGPTLPELLTDAEWNSLSRQMSDRGIPGFLAAQMKPIYITMMLGLSPCVMAEMQAGATGIDQRLGEYFEQVGRDNRSIEDTQTLIQVLDDLSSDDQIEILRLSLDVDIDPDDMMETLTQAYLREETALVWEYGKHLSLQAGGAGDEDDFAAFERALVTDRNLAWIDRLLADGAGKTNLVAVGAGHLPGETGLLNLLAQRGFALERLGLE